MTRFKNMKNDFRMLYNLSNRSGWGWDDHLHLPIATEEIWDEIYKECPRMRRFRNNPFPQYEVFETICGANVASGSMARLYRSGEYGRSNTMVDGMEQSEAPNNTDDFLSMHGVSYANIEPDYQTQINDDVEPSQHSGSKRSSGDKLQTRRKAKAVKKVDKQTEALTMNTENVVAMTSTMGQNFPYTMAECISKLKSIPNISVPSIIAVQEEIMCNTESRVILMLWEDEVLCEWIERTVTLHPQYCGQPAWH